MTEPAADWRPAFIRARLAEEEADARAAEYWPPSAVSSAISGDPFREFASSLTPKEGAHIARQDPPTTFVRVKRIRQLVREYEMVSRQAEVDIETSRIDPANRERVTWELKGRVLAMSAVMNYVAAIWRDHPDWGGNDAEGPTA